MQDEIWLCIGSWKLLGSVFQAIGEVTSPDDQMCLGHDMPQTTVEDLTDRAGLSSRGPCAKCKWGPCPPVFAFTIAYRLYKVWPAALV